SKGAVSKGISHQRGLRRCTARVAANMASVTADQSAKEAQSVIGVGHPLHHGRRHPHHQYGAEGHDQHQTYPQHGGKFGMVDDDGHCGDEKQQHPAEQSMGPLTQIGRFQQAQMQRQQDQREADDAAGEGQAGQPDDRLAQSIKAHNNQYLDQYDHAQPAAGFGRVKPAADFAGLRDLLRAHAGAVILDPDTGAVGNGQHHTPPRPFSGIVEQVGNQFGQVHRVDGHPHAFGRAKLEGAVGVQFAHGRKDREQRFGQMADLARTCLATGARAGRRTGAGKAKVDLLHHHMRLIEQGASGPCAGRLPGQPLGLVGDHGQRRAQTMRQIARLDPRPFDHRLIACDIGVEILDQRRNFGWIFAFEPGIGALAPASPCPFPCPSSHDAACGVYPPFAFV
ncbi:hypothetical protein E4T56_gene14312, partial [Termitomyces sp. T112]